jgi:hypothetical protein
MKIITRKSEVREILNICQETYRQSGLHALTNQVNIDLLQNKVKFPLLEFAAEEIFTSISEKEVLIFTDAVSELKTEGGNVILGIMLQKYSEINFAIAAEKASQYISEGEFWYCSDIIGERVWGVNLLNRTNEAINKLDEISNHESNFVVRSIGAGIHYATKIGIDKIFIPPLFSILLKNAGSKDKEIQKGMGWAAKTIMKFHPEMYEEFKTETNNFETVSSWFRKKIHMGLERNKLIRESRDR